jgi:hypothetical protein
MATNLSEDLINKITQRIKLLNEKQLVKFYNKMIKPKQKFSIGNEIIDLNGNSKSTKYKIIDVNWSESINTLVRKSCWRYTCSVVGDPEDIEFFYECEIKLSSDVCPCESYGNKMVGKTVKDVEFGWEELIIKFTDGYQAKFTAECGQNQGVFGFEGEN